MNRFITGLLVKVMKIPNDRRSNVPPSCSNERQPQSHSLAAGKFHEYVRLFEYAFAMQFSQLQRKLLQFLHPVYGYTSAEIKSWTQIRDPLTHADGKKSNEIYLDSDVRKVIQRMEQATYDVLFTNAAEGYQRMT